MNYSKIESLVGTGLKKNRGVMLLDKVMAYKGPFKMEQVDDKFFRSTNFRVHDFPQIAKEGIKVVYDLRSISEKECNFLSEEASKNGIKFVNVPINPLRIKKWFPTAVELVKNIKEKSLVHCTFGNDRTGFVSALREYFNGIPMAQAIKNMREKGYHRQIFYNIEMSLKKFAKKNEEINKKA